MELGDIAITGTRRKFIFVDFLEQLGKLWNLKSLPVIKIYPFGTPVILELSE